MGREAVEIAYLDLLLAKSRKKYECTIAGKKSGTSNFCQF
jgi:hypothetical protein